MIKNVCNIIELMCLSSIKKIDICLDCVKLSVKAFICIPSMSAILQVKVRVQGASDKPVCTMVW